MPGIARRISRIALVCVLGSTLWGSHAASAVNRANGRSMRPDDSAMVAGVVSTTPLSGATRYATAVAVSKESHPHGSECVVLATGENWPDAIGASAFAGAQAAPVLLVKRDQMPEVVLDRIAALQPEHVHVLGGEHAVSQAVVDALGEVDTPPATVDRIAGRDRYDTAARVASRTIAAQGPAGFSGHAFVATGRTYADALSVGPLAAASGSPVFLTDYGRWVSTIESMTACGVTDVTVLGGTRAVSAEVDQMLAAALGGPEHVDRVAGQDRYETATLLAERAVASAGFSYTRLGLAGGTAWADAAAAGPYLGATATPLVLVGRDRIDTTTASWLYARRSNVAGFVEFGGYAALAKTVREAAQHALMAAPFSTADAMSHISYLSGLGPRGAGGSAEHAAFDYVAGRLRSYGYDVRVTTVVLPGGATSHNVIAEHGGSEPGVIVLGAHVDSKPPSPGANDNASGVGVMLELARVLADSPTVPTIRFVAFGAEEIGGPTPDDHHFGSRQYVASLSSAERARIQGMVSVDMVGYGDILNVRSLRVARQTVVSSLQSRGAFIGVPVYFLLDPSSTGWSDHEAFEFAGIPAAWLEWRDDPVYHTVNDNAAHVQPGRVGAVGGLLRGWLLSMSPASLDALR